MNSPEQKTILLVEDEALIAMVVANTIKQFGYKVIIANSGEKAVEFAGKNKNISLVLMDLSLGKGIDGAEAAKQILSERTLPIVFLTSHDEKEYVDKVKEITRYGYVIKNSGDFVLESSIKMVFELFDAHEKTRESEERYRRIIEELTGYFYTVHIRDGKVVKITHSEACESVTGYRSEEFKASPHLWIDMVFPEDRRQVMKYVQRILSGKHISPIEHRIRRKDGQIRWVSHTPIVQFYPMGNLISYDGLVKDITRRKLMEEELRAHQAELEIQNKELRQAKAELEASRAELEHRVAERTEELRRANEELRLEIIDRKQMSEELKKSELRYRNLIYSLPDAIILHDGERILSSNPAALRHFGLKDKTNLIGKRILDFIDPGDREAVADSIESTRKTENITWVTKVKLVQDSAGFEYVECMNSIVDYVGRKLLLMSMRDITNRVSMEESLARTRHQQKAILDNVPDIAWLKDRESRFILANKPFGEACGIKPEDLPGKTDLDIWPRELAEKYRKDDREIIQSGMGKQIEELLTDKEGNIIWLETIKTPILNDRGNVIGTAGIARDITLRKQQEEQLRQYREQLEHLVEERTAELTEVNKLLQQELFEHKLTEEKVQKLNVELEERILELKTFNYSVSHDLKTPLIAIEGFSRILMEKHSQLLDAKGQHFLDIIYKSTKKVNELIEDLHEFFSVGQKAIKSSTINMEKMINDIITDFKTILPDDVFTVEFSALPPAYGDKKMINQVLVNLFGNAIKYSKPKGAAIITIEGRVKEGKSVYSVKDRGIGFPMECADNIFDVFERLHGSDEFEGTGIGLAIVKRIIQRHGGDVWAEGTVNEGATFYFSLPGKGA
jgi:PAS domain S-box-containing protein